MCILNFALVADSGITIKEEEQVCCLETEPQWAYEWRINDNWAKMMCELGKKRKIRTMSFDTDIMLPDNLHCTSHVVVE